MSTYNALVSISLGPENTGLTLSAVLTDALGNAQGGPITTGFAEIGQGNYLWSYLFPAQAQGVKIYSGETLLLVRSINPQDLGLIQGDAIQAIIQGTITGILTQVVDGTTTVAEILARINAYARGKILVSNQGQTVTYYDEQGNVLFVNNISSTERN